MAMATAAADPAVPGATGERPHPNQVATILAILSRIPPPGTDSVFRAVCEKRLSVPRFSEPPVYRLRFSRRLRKTAVCPPVFRAPGLPRFSGSHRAPYSPASSASSPAWIGDGITYFSAEDRKSVV